MFIADPTNPRKPYPNPVIFLTIEPVIEVKICSYSIKKN